MAYSHNKNAIDYQNAEESELEEVKLDIAVHSHFINDDCSACHCRDPIQILQNRVETHALHTAKSCVLCEHFS